MVNVMGDALATGIMAHICRKDFVKEGEQVRALKAKSMDAEAANYHGSLKKNNHVLLDVEDTESLQRSVG